MGKFQDGLDEIKADLSSILHMREYITDVMLVSNEANNLRAIAEELAAIWPDQCGMEMRTVMNNLAAKLDKTARGSQNMDEIAVANKNALEQAEAEASAVLDT